MEYKNNEKQGIVAECRASISCSKSARIPTTSMLTFAPISQDGGIFLGIHGASMGYGINPLKIKRGYLENPPSIDVFSQL